MTDKILSASEIRKLPRAERNAILSEAARHAIEDGLYAEVVHADELLGDQAGDLVAELRMLAGKLGPCWESDAMKRAAAQLAAMPAWHDRPTCKGDWMFVDKKGRKWLIEIYSDLGVGHHDAHGPGRWYGPIPADTQ